jgi:hypothetical protein
MQHLAFMGFIHLRIAYFEYFALALSINFMHVGKFLRKYGFTYVEGRLYCNLDLKLVFLYKNGTRFMAGKGIWGNQNVEAYISNKQFGIWEFSHLCFFVTKNIVRDFKETNASQRSAGFIYFVEALGQCPSTVPFTFVHAQELTCHVKWDIYFYFRSEHEMQQVESISQNNTVSTVW